MDSQMKRYTGNVEGVMSSGLPCLQLPRSPSNHVGHLFLYNAVSSCPLLPSPRVGGWGRTFQLQSFKITQSLQILVLSARCSTHLFLRSWRKYLKYSSNTVKNHYGLILSSYWKNSHFWCSFPYKWTNILKMGQFGPYIVAFGCSAWLPWMQRAKGLSVRKWARVPLYQHQPF